MHRKSLPVALKTVFVEGLRRPSVALWYSDRHSLVYVPIAKNANSYLKAIFLLNSSTTVDFDPTNETALSYLSRKQAPASLVMKKRSARFRNYTTFAVVRDPAQRIVSCFLDKCAKVKGSLGEKILINFCLDATKVLRHTVTPQSLTFSQFMNFVKIVPDWRRNHHYRTQAALLKNINIDVFFDVAEMEKILLFLENAGMRTELPQAAVTGIQKKTLYETNSCIPGMSEQPVKDLNRLAAFPSFQTFFGDKELSLLNSIYKDDIDLYCRVKEISTDQYWKRFNAGRSTQLD